MTGAIDAVDLGIMWDRLISITDEVLSALVRKTAKAARALNVDSPESLRATLQALAAQAEA